VRLIRVRLVLVNLNPINDTHIQKSELEWKSIKKKADILKKKERLPGVYNRKKFSLRARDRRRRKDFRAFIITNKQTLLSKQTNMPCFTESRTQRPKVSEWTHSPSESSRTVFLFVCVALRLSSTWIMICYVIVIRWPLGRLYAMICHAIQIQNLGWSFEVSCWTFYLNRVPELWRLQIRFLFWWPLWVSCLRERAVFNQCLPQNQKAYGVIWPQICTLFF